MTWKEYKNTRLTGKERMLLLCNPDIIYDALKSKEDINNLDDTTRSLLSKIQADKSEYSIIAILEVLRAIDRLEIEKRNM